MPNLYASRAEFKDRYGIVDTDRDMAIERILESSSRWVDQVLGRRFWTTDTPETRYYTASDSYWYLNVDDLLSVTTLLSDANGDGIFETTWTAGVDYFLSPRNAIADGEPYKCIEKLWWTGRYSFPAYDNAVQVTGQWGYCTINNVPPQIRELTLMVAEVDAMPILDLSMAGVQNYKLGTELTVTMGSKRLPARADELMSLFRKTKSWIA